MTEVRYRNHYCCAQDHAPELWDDTSESQNNDRCPICNAETEPHRSEVLGRIVSIERRLASIEAKLDREAKTDQTRNITSVRPEPSSPKTPPPPKPKR